MYKAAVNAPISVPQTHQSDAADWSANVHCRDNCAQYKAKCCLPEGPLLPDSPAAPASGSIALQWHLQDGSWQDLSSWSVLMIETQCTLDI